MTSISAVATTNREQARQGDGTFGHQNRTEAGAGVLAENLTYRLDETGTRGEWRLENDQTSPPPEKTDFGFRHTIRIGGTPHANVRQKAIKDAIEDAFDEDGPRPADTAHEIAAGPRSNAKATVLTVSDRGHVQVKEGTLTRDGGPRIVMLNKGSSQKGVYLDDDRILAVQPGYGGAEKLAAWYNEQAAAIPETEKVTTDNVIANIPDAGDGEPPSEIAEVFLVTNPDFNGGTIGGCMFLATDVQAEDGIVNGYFWAPESSGLYSETSSMYIDDLMSRGARVTGYTAGTVEMSDLWKDPAFKSDRATAYRAVLAH